MKKSLTTTALLFTILLTACGSATPEATPTAVDINVLQTAAVQTVVANITQTAFAFTPTPLPPTETPVPLPTETPTPAGTATLATCDNAVFVADVSVPDGTQMIAGQDFVKTWKVRNTGACTWKTGYQLILSYGSRMSGQSTALTTDVLPNTEVEISVNLKAPNAAGTYSGYWVLRNNNGYTFGQILTVVIVVP
jgi:next-to-BRCA1 protein 1